jgi:hypothetical protein
VTSSIHVSRCRALVWQRWQIDGHVQFLMQDLSLPPPHDDELTLWVQRRSGETKMIKLRRLPKEKVRSRSTTAFKVRHAYVPTYVKGLTNVYHLDMIYWEVVECFRKAMLVGLPAFLQFGSLQNITVGIILAITFIVVYNLFKPYDQWQAMRCSAQNLMCC